MSKRSKSQIARETKAIAKALTKHNLPAATFETSEDEWGQEQSRVLTAGFAVEANEVYAEGEIGGWAIRYYVEWRGENRSERLYRVTDLAAALILEGYDVVTATGSTVVGVR